MSKKLIVLIQLVVCVAAVVIISLYGRNPEMWKDFQYVEEIYFIVNDERVQDGYELELASGTTTYQLVWFVGPDNATIKEVRFESSNPDKVAVNENGQVTFSSDEGAVIYMYTTDNSLLNAHINLTIKPAGGGVLPL